MHAPSNKISHLVKFVPGDVRPVPGSDGPEGVFDLLGTVDIFGLLGDHEGHVLLQRHEAVPVGVHHVEDGLELGVLLAVLHHRQVVAQRPQARLELGVVEAPALLLVEVLGGGGGAE